MPPWLSFSERAGKVTARGSGWAILALGCRERDGSTDPPRGSALHRPPGLNQNVLTSAADAAAAAGLQRSLDGAEQLELRQVWRQQLEENRKLRVVCWEIRA